MYNLALLTPFLWFIFICAGLITFLFIFFDHRLYELHTHWTTAGDLDMGYPLLAITLFLCFKASQRIKELSPNLIFLPVILLLSLLLFASSILDIKTLFFVGLFLTLPALVLGILGKQAALRLFLPIAITFMAMPFWYLAVSTLQNITVVVVSFLAEKLQLTVLVEGNYFTIPTGVVHVAGGCSGLKYFLSGLTISLISSAFSSRGLKFTLLSLFCAGLLAIIGNWIRVFILLLVGYYEGVSHPLMDDHDTLGWFVFAGVMIPWFFLDNKLEKTKRNDTPVSSDESLPAIIQTRKIAVSFTIALVLMLLPGFLLMNEKQNNLAAKSLIVPETLASFSLIQSAKAVHKLNYPEPQLSFSGQYQNENQKLEVHVLTYDLQGDIEMANTTNTIFHPDSWFLITDKAYLDADNPDRKLRITIARQGNLKRIVYYWYKHDSAMANSILQSKLAQLASLLTGDSTGHLVAISRNCVFDCSVPEQLEPELAELIKALQQKIALQESRAAGVQN